MGSKLVTYGLGVVVVVLGVWVATSGRIPNPLAKAAS